MGTDVMETYSRGWRGAPAKGVGRETGARVQIPPSPPKRINHINAWISSVYTVFISITINSVYLF